MGNEAAGDFLLPCTLCAKSCYAVHGKHREKKRFDGCFYFFKIMLGDFAHKMRIPPAFVPKLRNDIGIGGNVVLQGPSNQRWDVKLSGTNTEMEFVQGWENFVHHHKIEFGDFLVFRYIYMSYFKVRIFGRSGCQKNIDFLDPQNTHHHFECSAIVKSSTTMGTFDQPIESQLPIFMVSDEENNDQAEAIPQKQGKNRPGRPPKKHQMETERRSYQKTYYISCRRPVTEAERNNALEAAKSFTSNRPFSLVILTQSYVYYGFWLRISKTCANSLQLPKERTRLTLVDPNSKEWHVQYLGHLERAALSGGWGHFSRGNNLEEGDACIFERVDNNKKKIKIRVHIFRVVKECTPYKRMKVRKVNDNLALLTNHCNKKMEVSSEDLGPHLSAKAFECEEGNYGKQRMKQLQGKKEKASTRSNKNNLAKSTCTAAISDMKGVCRHSKRFAQTCNLVECPKKETLCIVSSVDGQESILRDTVALSKSIISLDDINCNREEKDLIIWDNHNATHTIASSSRALIPYGDSIHQLPLMTESIVPMLNNKSEALKLVVALSPEETTSVVDKKGEANWQTSSGISDKTGTSYNSVIGAC